MIEYNVGAWLTLGIAFKKSNPSPAANVRRTQLHSVSAVSVRAAKTAYPLSPSSFPIRRFSWGNLRFGVTGEIRYEHSYHLVRQKKMSHGKTQKPQRFPGFFTSIFRGLLSFSRKCPVRDCVARSVFHVRLLRWGLLRKNRPQCHQLYCSAIMVMSSNCGSCPTNVSICCLI